MKFYLATLTGAALLAATLLAAPAYADMPVKLQGHWCVHKDTFNNNGDLVYYRATNLALPLEIRKARKTTRSRSALSASIGPAFPAKWKT